MSDYTATVNRYGGRLSIKLNLCNEKIIDVVTDATKVTKECSWFCLAADVPKIILAIQRLGQPGLNSLVIEKGIRFNVIYENR